MGLSNTEYLIATKLRLTGDGDFWLDIPSISVEPGVSITLIGANGSGKSTLLESLLDLRKSVSGDVSFFGIPNSRFFKSQARRRLGVQLQKAGFNDDYLVREVVALHSSAYGKCDAQVADLLGVEMLKHKKYGNLSRGEKQRLDLYLGVAHDPDFLILDEPSTGLDGNYATAFKQVLSQIRRKRESLSVLSASHDEKEVDNSNQIIWMQRGKIYDSGSLSELLDSHLGEISISLTFPEHQIASEYANKFAEDRKIKYVRLRDETTIVACGEQSIEEYVENIGEQASIIGYSVDQLTAKDLLNLVSERSNYA